MLDNLFVWPSYAVTNTWQHRPQAGHALTLIKRLVLPVLWHLLQHYHHWINHTCPNLLTGLFLQDRGNKHWPTCIVFFLHSIIHTYISVIIPVQFIFCFQDFFTITISGTVEPRLTDFTVLLSLFFSLEFILLTEKCGQTEIWNSDLSWKSDNSVIFPIL